MQLLEENLVKVQNLDVDGTCVALKACDGELVEPVEVGDTCSECAQIADLVLKELQDPAVQEELEAVLELVRSKGNNYTEEDVEVSYYISSLSQRRSKA